MGVNIIFKSLIYFWTFSLSTTSDGDMHPAWKFLPKHNCGIGSLTDRIIGGKEATLGQFPWIARIGYDVFQNKKKIYYLCAGAIINRWHVLTASHCYEDYIVSVRLGEHYTQRKVDCQNGICATPVQDIPIEYVKNFEDLNEPDITHGDLALIKLAQPAIFNDFVQPICLPRGQIASRHNELAGKGNYLEVAGWGVKDETNKSSDKLLYISIPVVDIKTCQQMFPMNRIDESQICVGNGKGKDTCLGDSGGPLMRAVALKSSPKYYLFGVVSYGLTNCGVGSAIYTSVNHYMNWILDNIQPLT